MIGNNCVGFVVMILVVGIKHKYPNKHHTVRFKDSLFMGV